MEIDHPFRIDATGRTATTDDDDHVRDLIELVLFTAPGERVNRPTFGTGLLRLVFAGLDPDVAASTQLLVQGALQQWLGDRITVEAVEVTAVESRLDVVVRYRRRVSGQPRVERFTQAV